MVCFDIWFFILKCFNVLLCIRLYYLVCFLCMYVYDSYRFLRKEICYILRKKLIERNKNFKIFLFIGNIFYNIFFSFLKF